MPSKRQPSKQRRAAQNRAARAALATRKENANRPADEGPASTSRTADAKPGRGQRAAGAPQSTNALPGGKAALFALVFSGAAAIALLLLPVRVDAKGEPLTSAEIKKADKADDAVLKDSAVSAYGAVIFLVAAAPMAATAFGYQAVRQRRSSRWVMGALGGLALMTIFSPLPILFLPSMAALVFAQAQVKKHERLAAAAAAPVDGEVIDVDEVDTDDDR